MWCLRRPRSFSPGLDREHLLFRQDIREDRGGVPLRQKIRILGAENCDPMPNVRVNIWHCDRDGDYSGYAAMGSEGQTYCRGYQMTDANGECEFVTIFPGWYPGRTTHVHFQVHVSSQYSVVSQWTWPHAAAVEVATAHSALYPEGLISLPSQDGVFTDGSNCNWQTLRGTRPPRNTCPTTKRPSKGQESTAWGTRSW